MKRKIIIPIILGLSISIIALAKSSYTEDSNQDGKPDQWITVDDQNTIVERDRNFDGKIDHITKYDDHNKKTYEEQDYNFDGEMDDFYYYGDGLLLRQEIDSNYDSAIDIWIHIKDGKFIQKYERDTDYDGVADVVKRYE